MVIFIELLPENTDEFNFANTGCPAGTACIGST
jgi:hypothetical protein